MVLVAVQLSVLGIVSPACVEIVECHRPAPDDHFAASPHCRVTSICAVGALVVLVAIQLSVPGLYLPPVLKRVDATGSTPHDHFAAGPHCRVKVAAVGRVGGAGGCPTIRAGIVSPASVRKMLPDQFRPRRSFHCRSTPPCDRIEAVGRVGGAGGCPTVRAGIVSPARVQMIRQNPQFRPRRSFHCRSTLPCD